MTFHFYHLKTMKIEEVITGGGGISYLELWKWIFLKQEKMEMKRNVYLSIQSMKRFLTATKAYSQCGVAPSVPTLPIWELVAFGRRDFEILRISGFWNFQKILKAKVLLAILVIKSRDHDVTDRNKTTKYRWLPRYLYRYHRWFMPNLVSAKGEIGS